VRETEYLIIAGSVFSGRPMVFFNFLLLFSFIINPFLISTKSRLRRSFLPPARASCSASENTFEMLRTQLAVFFRTQKSALRDGLDLTGKIGSKPILLKSICQVCFA